MIDNRTVGKAIASLRQSKGMTQQQLAAALNVSHQAVSKWENGAALPDIQTLVELTQLFGITVEQLLKGEIPEARLEKESSTTTLDEHIQNIGNFVGGVIDDIGNMFKTEPAPSEDAPNDDGAEAAEVVEENDAESNIDIQQLLQMAPFMSKGAVAEMLKNFKGKLTAADIASFAPFIDSACLEKLIRECEPEISWDTLRKIAPFLKKEVVDALARTVAMGERIGRQAPEGLGQATEDVYRTLDDVSRKISKGMDKAVRKVVRIGENVASEISKAFDDTPNELSREERLARLRRSAFERALEDGKWDWIEAHISEIQDDDLKRKISETANRQGMQDWVFKNLGGFADPQIIENTIAEGDWGWLGEHVWQFDVPMQQHVALAAMKAENWQWLSTYAEQLELQDCVVEIAGTARRAGARMLAVQLTNYDMTDEQVEQMAIEAGGAGDLEFIEMLGARLSQETLCRCCIRLGKSGSWDDVKRLAEKLNSKNIEWLMQIAIDAGNFEAIDMLDALLKMKETESDSM